MRNEIIDIAKGYGILLVVLGHNWIVSHQSGELFRLIFSFHMPLFFFISGIFVNPRSSFKKIIYQKTQSLLKPYLVVMLAVAIGLAISGKTIPYGNVLGIAYATSQSLLWMQMWFLPHLFLATIFSYALIRVMGGAVRKPTVAFVTLLGILMTGVALIGYFGTFSVVQLEIKPGLPRPIIGLPFSADLLFISSAYLLAGYVFSDWVKNFKVSCAALLLSIAVFVACHTFFDEAMNLAARVYGSPIISTAQAASGIYLTFCLSVFTLRYKAIEKAISYIGSGSLFILIFHGILQGIVTHKAHSLFPTHQEWGAVFGMASAVLISLLIWESAKRIPVAKLLLLETRR